MSYIEPIIKEKFDIMFDNAKKIISDSGIKYIMLGIFGSYARGEYNGRSDIDFVLIFDEAPDRRQIAILRCDLDEIGCDLATLSIDSFNNPTNWFQKCVKRDFVEVIL